MPTGDTNVVTSSSRTVREVKQVTDYVDGLGRPLQSVTKGVSPSGRDMVKMFLYDAYGREPLQYLPYVPNSSDGNLKGDPFNAQRAFYRDNNLIPGIGSDSIYHAETAFESSPLNRVLKQYAPGNAWAKSGGNHPVQQQYLTNKVSDSVRIWTFSNGSIIPVSTKTYIPGELYKNVTIDENGIQVVVYKDIDGRVVLKKHQLASNPGTAHMGWLCTYYCYDDLGNQNCVIPPKAVDLIKSNWTLSNAIAAELCFLYRYDEQNRVIVKKMPGADSTEIVYDVRDRIAFMRSAVMKAQSQWMFHFYDSLNRPTMKALCYITETRANLQATMNTATSNNMNIPYTFPGTGDLYVMEHLGDALYEAKSSITFTGNFDSGNNADFIAQINSNTTNGADTISATNPHPYVLPAGLIPISYTYYDDYSYPGKFDYQSSDAVKPVA